MLSVASHIIAILFLVLPLPAFLFFYKVEISKYTLLPPDNVISLEDIRYNWSVLPKKVFNDEWYFKMVSVLVFFYMLLAFSDITKYYFSMKLP